MKTAAMKSAIPTPWFSKIPYLGSLFRHTVDSSRKTELVILLRATVVEDADWSIPVQKTAERLNELWNLEHGRPVPKGWKATRPAAVAP